MREKITQALLNSIKEYPVEITDTELPGFLCRIDTQGRAAFYARFRLPNGKQSKSKVGAGHETTPSQAREEAKRVLADARRGVDPIEAKRQARAARQRHTVESFLDKVYLPHITAQAKHVRRGEMVARAKRAAAGQLQAPLGELDPGKVDRVRAERLANGLSEATVNKDLAGLKTALNRAVEWGIIEANPLRNVKKLREVERHRLRYLDESALVDDKGERTRLLEALESRETGIREHRRNHNDWLAARGHETRPDLDGTPFADYLRPLVLLALNTGMRRGELFQLTWADVDLERGILSVRGDSAKSGKHRHIPINRQAREVLEGWRKMSDTSNPLVFPSPQTGRKLDNINTSWETIVEAAKLADFRFHDLRHTFASSLVQRGVDLNTVRQLLGHSDIKLTLRYAHLAPQQLAQAVATLDSIDRSNVRKPTARKGNQKG